MSIKTSFRDWLKARRRVLDLTQAQLAERVGCALQTIRYIETGARRPSRQLAQRLAQSLEIPPAERAQFIDLARSCAQQDTTFSTVPPASSQERLAASPFRVPFSTNLPLQLTSFIGRQREVAEVSQLLANQRLVTLTGVGGTGKTRLALQIAGHLVDSFPQGVWLVELASLQDGTLLPQAIATVGGIQEEPMRPLLETLVETLRDRQQLLVLDNCEHLILSCASLVAQLLRTCPHLHILATSREPLGLLGEQSYAVQPLEVPDPVHDSSPEQVTAYSAVSLFLERVQAVQPHFQLTSELAPVVAEICQRLDGLPLALELAASHLRHLTAPMLLRRLSQRLQLLVGGVRNLPARQQTLRATIAWSYEHLEPDEQRMFRRLGVFVGGWTLEAAEAMSGGDELPQEQVLRLLGQLVDKSLVVLEANKGLEGGRYHMLATLREYALEQLEAQGELETMRNKHLYFFLNLAEIANRKFSSPERLAWLDRVALEYDNVRAALHWESERGDVEGWLRLVGALWKFWEVHRLREGRNWLEAALGASEGVQGSRGRAKALATAGWLHWLLGQAELAHSQLEEALHLWRRLGDKQELTFVLPRLALLALAAGDYATARARGEESLALCRELGDQWSVSLHLSYLGDVVVLQDPNAARALYEQSLALLQQLGDLKATGLPLTSLGRLALHQGDYARAFALTAEALALRRQAGDKWFVAVSLNSLGDVARCQGEYEQAATLYEEGLQLGREMGNRPVIAWSLYNLGAAVLAQGENRRAGELLSESLRREHQLGSLPGVARCLAGLAGVAGATGQVVRAARLLGATESLLAMLGIQLEPPDRLALERHVVAIGEQLDPATFEAAWQEGQAMTVQQAIAYAQQVCTPFSSE